MFLNYSLPSASKSAKTPSNPSETILIVTAIEPEVVLVVVVASWVVVVSPSPVVVSTSVVVVGSFVVVVVEGRTTPQ